MFSKAGPIRLLKAWTPVKKQMNVLSSFAGMSTFENRPIEKRFDFNAGFPNLRIFTPSPERAQLNAREPCGMATGVCMVTFSWASISPRSMPSLSCCIIQLASVSRGGVSMLPTSRPSADGLKASAIFPVGGVSEVSERGLEGVWIVSGVRNS